jgi:hypothetical protein
MMTWVLRHPKATFQMLGYIPSFFSESDPRPAREQIDSAYKYGGGWHPFTGFKMLPDGSLKYPKDPPLPLLAESILHNEEIIRFYSHSWVAIVQLDGTFETARID